MGRHIGSKTWPQCFVYARSAAPTGPTHFCWSRACYQYTGPLGHNPLGTYVPAKPQRGDISVAKHRRASVPKAPAGRHIGSQDIGAMFCLRAVCRPYRANMFLLVAGLLPIYWPSGPQTARPIRAGKAPAGRHIGSKASARQRPQSPVGATYR